MTAPLRGTLRASALPASQSAPVAEFRCLFTHDLKRKQKRWQDGFLKFHTFNSRVMVYDQVRNHVGDTYWKESTELQEGDELSLDRGVMVEVAEAVGVTQTDLTPLFEKKTKEQMLEPPGPPRPIPASASVRPYQRPTPAAPAQIPRNGTQLRHKSLNTLLGPSRGSIGKAMPMKSPFEARKEQENEWAEGRAAKRQKTDQRSGTWRASSPVQEQPTPVKNVPKPQPAADTPRSVPQKPKRTDIVDLSSEPDLPEETDVSWPSPPSGYVARTKVLPVSKPIPQAPKLSPTPKPVPKAPKVPLAPRLAPHAKEVTIPRPAPLAKEITTPKPAPIVKRATTPKLPAPPSSPPVSASNRLSNVDVAVQSTRKPPEEPAPPQSPPRKLKAKSLRLSVGVRRGKMLCQSLPQPSSRSQSAIRSSRAEPIASRNSQKDAPRIDSLNPVPPSSPRPSAKRRASPVLEQRQKKKKAKAASPLPEVSDDIFEVHDDPFEDPELVHGMMDQQLLISPLRGEPSDSRPTSKESQAATIARPCEKEDDTSMPEKDTRVRSITRKQSKPTRPKPSYKPSVGESNHEQDGQRDHSILAAAHRFEPPTVTSRAVSPAHTDISGTTSRTGSLSPSKLPPSAGGFRKKQKSPKRASESPAPDGPPLVPRKETVCLPPHPLRASKDGPLLTTTELQSRLQRPKKRRNGDDPIEEGSQPTGKSPNRAFRRVRSENDAPIPSTAQEWEKRNLPNATSDLTDPGSALVPVPGPKRPKLGGLAALVKKTDPRKKFTRTQSLTIDTSAASIAEPELPSPVIDIDVGPWSTEAFDLFDWRPPNRNIDAEVDE